jgi:two-component system OmpR family response regulator
LLIVDRMLPGLDGIGLVQALRVTGVKAPVLFLPAICLCRPTSPHQRIGAAPAAQRYAYGSAGWRPRKMDLLKRTVLRGGKPVKLQPREFQLLEFLMRNADRVVMYPTIERTPVYARCQSLPSSSIGCVPTTARASCTEGKTHG